MSTYMSDHVAEFLDGRDGGVHLPHQVHVETGQVGYVVPQQGAWYGHLAIAGGNGPWIGQHGGPAEDGLVHRLGPSRNCNIV